MSEHESSSPAAPPATPGADLRKVRETAGMSLQDISDKTLISVSRLRALEEDDYERVGTATYVTGYTRAYARVLGIDPGHYIRQMEEIMGVNRERPPTEEEAGPIDTYRKPLPFTPFVVAALLLLVLAITGVVMLFGGSESERVSVVANSTVDRASSSNGPEGSVVGAPASEPEMQPRSESVVPAVSERVAPEPAPASPSQTQAVQFPAVEEAAEVVSDQRLPPADSADPVLPVTSDTLTFHFSEECWVQIVDGTGKRLYTGVRAPGESLRVNGYAPFEVKLGNSRVVEIELNNQPVTINPRPGYRTLDMTIGS